MGLARGITDLTKKTTKKLITEIERGVHKEEKEEWVAEQWEVDGRGRQGGVRGRETQSRREERK